MAHVLLIGEMYRMNIVLISPYAVDASISSSRTCAWKHVMRKFSIGKVWQRWDWERRFINIVASRWDGLVDLNYKNRHNLKNKILDKYIKKFFNDVVEEYGKARKNFT